MRLFDFICYDCNNQFEALVRSYKDTSNCTLCSKPVSAIVSPVRISLDGTDPGFPRAWDQWAKMREQKIAVERKQKES